MSTPTWWLGPDSCTVGSDSLERNAKGSPRMSSLAVTGWACGFASATNSGSVRSFGSGGNRLFVRRSALATPSAELISGGADRYTPADQMMARFAGIFPNHEDVSIPHAGHFFPESSPEETTEAIREWLDEQPRSGH